MKAAVLVFMLAAVFAAVVVLGVVRLGSPEPPAPAIVLHGRGRDGVPARPPTRSAVRQRVEDATLGAYAARRARGGRP